MRNISYNRYLTKTRAVAIKVSIQEQDILKAESRRLGKTVSALIREGYLDKIGRMLV